MTCNIVTGLILLDLLIFINKTRNYTEHYFFNYLVKNIKNPTNPPHPTNPKACFLKHFSFTFRMGFLLNQSGHLHSHSHSHPHSHVPQPNSPNTAQGSSHAHSSSLAVRAAFVHALGDLVQSIGVLVAAYIIRFKVRKARGVLAISAPVVKVKRDLVL